MNQLSLKGKRPKEKYHSYKGDVGKVADNIINRDFSTEKPLQKWTTDVSQFNLPWGKCYISPILDMNTNEVISYNLSLSPNVAGHPLRSATDRCLGGPLPHQLANQYRPDARQGEVRELLWRRHPERTLPAHQPDHRHLQHEQLDRWRRCLAQPVLLDE